MSLSNGGASQMHHRYFRRYTKADRKDRASKTAGNDQVTGLRQKVQVPCNPCSFRFNNVAVDNSFPAGLPGTWVVIPDGIHDH